MRGSFIQLNAPKFRRTRNRIKLPLMKKPRSCFGPEQTSITTPMPSISVTVTKTATASFLEK